MRAQFRPSGYLGIVLKGGIEERDPDRYDVELGESLGQNSLMRKYNMAYRYRQYSEAMANVALGSLPLSLGFSGFYADDEYNRSEIGLRKGLDRRFGVDLSWTVSDKVTAYATAGREKISADTSGSSVFAAPDWNGRVRDDFKSGSVGLRMRLAEGVTLDLDYTEADGETDTEVAGDAFPTVESNLAHRCVPTSASSSASAPRSCSAGGTSTSTARTGRCRASARTRCRPCSRSASTRTTTASTTSRPRCAIGSARAGSSCRSERHLHRRARLRRARPRARRSRA